MLLPICLARASLLKTLVVHASGTFPASGATDVTGVTGCCISPTPCAQHCGSWAWPIVDSLLAEQGSDDSGNLPSEEGLMQEFKDLHTSWARSEARGERREESSGK